MLTDTVKQLESHKNEVLARIESLQAEVSKIDEALAALNSVGGNSGHLNGGTSVVVSTDGRKTRKMSAAGLARIKAAQKLRWAKYKKENAGSASAPASARSKPKFSAAGIAKIRAAQKLRWAKFNAAKGGKK